MAEDKKEFGVLSDLAEIADALLLIYRGRATVILELDKDEFNATLNFYKGVDKNCDKFKIDISGVEFIYMKMPTEE
jgi:hypothetical protein